MNPWLLWSLNMRTMRMALETLDASARVIDRRTHIIRNAVHDPLTADHAELGLMVSEKLLAFSEAGQSAASDWMKLQGMWLSQLGRLGAVTNRNLIAAMGAAAGSAGDPAKLLEHANRSMVRAMTPIHSKATANARRLKPGRKRRS